MWGKAAIAGVTFITTTFAILKLRKMFSTKTDEVVRFEEVKDELSETPDQTTSNEQQLKDALNAETSEAQFGVYPKPLDEKKKVNPWVVPERTVTHLDFSTSRITEKSALERNLSFNVMLCEMNGNDGREYVGRFHMLALSSTVFVTMDHCLEKGAPYFDITVHFGAVGRAVS